MTLMNRERLAFGLVGLGLIGVGSYLWLHRETLPLTVEERRERQAEQALRDEIRADVRRSVEHKGDVPVDGD